MLGYNPQESLENTINTMGTLLGVHPVAPVLSLYPRLEQSASLKRGVEAVQTWGVVEKEGAVVAPGRPPMGTCP